MRHALALSTFVCVLCASVYASALPTICIPPDTKQERVELAKTLTTMGYTVVDSNDPVTSNCDVYTAAYFNSNIAPDSELNPWMEAGGLHIQMLSGPPTIEVAFYRLHHTDPAELVVVDRTHPMTHCLPARWNATGAAQYPLDPSFGLVDIVTPYDRTLPILGRFTSGRYFNRPVLTTKVVGSGRVILLGWNLYGPAASPEDLQLLDNAIRWGTGYEGGQDSDCDGFWDGEDLCPDVPTTTQDDLDGDGLGDACDADIDGDGLPNGTDLCPYLATTSAEPDTDNDSVGDACDDDLDGDGVDNTLDVCPAIPNPDQDDLDTDGVGDLCDEDVDGDGLNNEADLCPRTADPTNVDSDGDEVGDVCDADLDGDGIVNEDDLCPFVPNPDQQDSDGDAIGDDCDDDIDGDGVLNEDDLCPLTVDPSNADSDGDEVGDVCDDDVDGDGAPNQTDLCPDTADPEQHDLDGDGLGDACDDDTDGDGVPDLIDHCPGTADTRNADLDGDGIGDVCDEDIDGDGVPNLDDTCPMTPDVAQLDEDQDGIGDACEGDFDGDGVIDDVDNCPDLHAPEQGDLDADGIGDPCDDDADGDGLIAAQDCDDLDPDSPSLWFEDTDGDGVGTGDGQLGCDPPDSRHVVAVGGDNCPNTPNASQDDANADGLGDACDEEFEFVEADRKKTRQSGCRTAPTPSPGSLLLMLGFLVAVRRPRRRRAGSGILFGQLPYRVFILLATLVLPACSAEHDTEATGDDVQVRRQALCGANECDLGSTACAFSGVITCIDDNDGDACGVWSSSSPCSGTDMCYFGQCVQDIVVAAPSDGTSSLELESLATDHLTSLYFVDNDNPLVIPYSAYIAALKGRPFTKPADSTAARAAKLAAVANDPAVIGMRADYRTETAFDGELFIVVSDAEKFSDTAGEFVEFTNYFIAAVNLSGKTSWVADMPRAYLSASFGANQSGQIPTTSGCCRLGGTQPNDACVDGPPPDPGCGGGQVDCPAYLSDFGVTTTTLPAEEPYRWGTATTDASGATFLPNGRAVVHTLLYLDREEHYPTYARDETEFPISNGVLSTQSPHPEPGKRPGEPVHRPPTSAKCDSCAVLDCAPPSLADYSVDTTLDPPPVAGPCGAIRATVSDLCTQVSDPGVLGASCQTVCNSCFATHGGVCWAGPVRFANQFQIGDSQPKDPCSPDSKLPDYCKRVSGADGPISPCECAAECQDHQDQFWADFYGCSTDGVSNSPNAECVGENGVCLKPASSGLAVCRVCTDDHGCVSYAQHDPSGTYQQSCGTFGIDSNGDFSANPCEMPKTEDNSTTNTGDWDMGIMVDVDPDPSRENEPTHKPPGRSLTELLQDVGAAITQVVVAIADWLADAALSGKSSGQSAQRGLPSAGKNQALFDPDGADLSTSGTTKNDGPKKGKSTDADPVQVGSGALQIDVTDLRFPGTRELSFSRSYNSQSNDRSILGSNWSHNWDLRVMPLKPGTAPAWAPPYCVEWQPEISCVAFYVRDGFSIFVRDPASGVFMPPAGSTDSIIYDGGAREWLLRRADGNQLRFHGDHGHLLGDRDRFGNGFALEWEPMPLFLLYRRYCHRKSYQYDVKQDGRVCQYLGWLFDEQPMPDVHSEGFETVRASTGRAEISLPFEQPDGAIFPTDPEDSGHPIGDYREAIASGVASLQQLLSTELFPHVPSGSRRYRLKTVRDDLGRALSFSYGDGPDSNLLAKVTGPGGAVVEYQYDAPPELASRQNERFLTQVSRNDEASTAQWVTPSPPRTVSYDYLWPSWNPLVATWDNETLWGSYKTSLIDYFGTFTGCQTGQQVVCIGMAHSQRPGNPCWLGERAFQEFQSASADNIVAVRHNTTQYEVESRYQTDPIDENFDRISAQRYGGTEDLTMPQADWDTKYPQYSLDYLSAQRSAVDPTTSFIPAAIASAYPSETVPEEAKSCRDVPCTSDGECGCLLMDSPDNYAVPTCNNARTFSHDNTGSDCSPNDQRVLAAQLGQLKTYDYYDAPDLRLAGTEQRKAITRTRLTCEQLAVFQTANAVHNDNQAMIQPPATTGEQERWAQVAGSRDRIERNLRRICAWTAITDRTGAQKHYGLNYRGQAVVIASALGTDLIVKETLFNADGNVIEDRLPVRLPQSDRPTSGVWQQNGGLTERTYETSRTVDSNGKETWTLWKPMYWSRRDNLVREAVYPAGSPVSTKQWNSGTDTFTQAQSAGRVANYVYEPYFNELRVATWGTLEDEEQLQLVRDFDFQEMALAGLATLEVSLQRFGVRWLLDDAIAIAWQRDFPTYDADLNGNGIVTEPRGTVVRTTLRDLKGGVDRVWHQQSAANGRPSMIAGPGGQLTYFEYYRNDTAQGDEERFGAADSDPNLTSVNFAGLMGRVRTRRFDPAPTTTGCTELPAPYQQLLPDCASGAVVALKGLGLSDDVIDGLMFAGQDPSFAWSETFITYAPTGHAAYISTNGADQFITSDVDGRIVQTRQTSPSLDTVNEYDASADLVSVTVSKGAEVVYRETREYDNAHALVARCVALEQSTACDDLLAAPRTSFSTSRDPNSQANRQLFTYRYDDEDRLVGEIDELGLEKEYQRDELGRLASILVKDVQTRTLTLTRDDRGNVTDALLTAPGVSLTSSFEYDGFDRLRATVDRRGLRWEHHFDALGYESHSEAVNAPTQRDHRWARNGFGEVLSEKINGAIERTYTDLDNDGRFEQIQTTGGGVTKRRFDSQGNVLWQRTPDGTDEILVLDPTTYQYSPCGIDQVTWSEDEPCKRIYRATIHRDGTPQTSESTRATSTTVLTHLDGFAYGSIVSGHSVVGSNPHQLETIRERTAMGQVAREWTRLGPNETYSDTHITRNLVGWVTGTVRTIDEGLLTSDGTTFDLNAAGQILQTVDPAGADTMHIYDRAGRTVQTIQQAGNTSGVLETEYLYDGLGRVQMRRSPIDDVEYVYDLVGDLEEIHSGAPLLEWRRDLLGRVVVETAYNSAVGAGRDVSTEYTYDALDRVLVESLSVHGMTFDVTSSFATNTLGGWDRAVSYPGAGGYAQGPLVRTTDAAGRLIGIEVPGGAGTRNIAFNWMGLTQIEQSHDWGGSEPLVKTTQLDSFGRPVALQYRAVELDANNDPIDSNWADNYCNGWDPGCEAPLLRYRMRRDGIGRVRSAESDWANLSRVAGNPALAQGAPQSDWWGWDFNAGGQLIGEYWNPDVDSTGSFHDLLDDHHLGNPDTSTLGAANPDFVTSWGFSRDVKVGSLNSIDWLNGPGDPDEHRFATTRVAGYELSTVTLPDLASGSRDAYISHDGNGRVADISHPTGTSLHFDPLNRLAATDVGGELLYDARGRLVFDGGLYLVWDDDQMIGGFPDPTGAEWSAIWGGALDQLIEVQSQSDVLVPLTDFRNSVVGVWSASSKISAVAQYDTHGLQNVWTGYSTPCRQFASPTVDPFLPCQQALGIPFGFASTYQPHNLNLQYMRNRWYSPDLRQFLSHDPLGAIDSHNLYAYVGMDPINGWDPYGLSNRGFVPNQDGFCTASCTPRGVGNFLLDADRGFIKGTDWLGAFNARQTDGAVDFWMDSYRGASGVSAFGYGVGFTIAHTWGMMTPQSGHELRLGMAMSAGALAFKPNLLDDVVAGTSEIGRRLGARNGPVVGPRLLSTQKTKPGAAGPPPACFATGTLVATEDGLQPIEEIKVGDLVWARDDQTGEDGWKPVFEVFITPDRELLSLTFEGSDGTAQVLHVTAEHPLWSLDDARWEKAGELEIGERVDALDGSMRLVGGAVLSSTETVYNFEVADSHTYFVGESGVWAHNECVDELSKAASVPGKGGELTEAGRSLQKHGNRPGSAFPKPSGSPTDMNTMGQNVVDDILTHPESSIIRGTRGRFGEVIEVRDPSGRGVRYSHDGQFLHFLEP